MHPKTALFQVEFIRGRDAPGLRVVVDVAVAGLRLHVEFAGVGIALAGIGRVLRPDGLFVAAFIGGMSLVELRACLYETI